MKIMSNIVSRRKPKVMKFVAVVFTLALVALTLPTTTWAGDTFRFKGQSADAFFSSTDQSGCIVTDVFVFASDDASVSHDPPGPPNSFSGSGAFIGISKFDYCTYTQLVAADCFTPAPLADQDFQVIGKKLDSAELNATLECFGFDFVSNLPLDFNVDANLVWTGTGNPIRQSSNFHFRTPGFIINERSSGTFSPADVSGSVSDESTNFTPNPGFGNIMSVKSGTATID